MSVYENTDQLMDTLRETYVSRFLECGLSRDDALMAANEHLSFVIERLRYAHTIISAEAGRAAGKAIGSGIMAGIHKRNA